MIYGYINDLGIKVLSALILLLCIRGHFFFVGSLKEKFYMDYETKQTS